MNVPNDPSDPHFRQTPERQPEQRGRRPWIVLVTLLVLGVSAGVVIWTRYRASHPSAGTYREIVARFSVGVAGLDVDDLDHARTALTRAAELTPAEPAVWADLGLLALRLGDFATAAQDLTKAQALAPDSAEVELLIGLLESRRGDFAAAIEHLRRAVSLQPTNLRARYALMGAIERQGGADALAQEREQVDAMLQSAPRNLAVLVDGLRLAIKAGDAKTTAALTQRIADRSSGWPPEVLEQLTALQKAVGQIDMRTASTQVLFLRNVFAVLPDFRRDLTAVQSPIERVGEPIRHFLKLPVPIPAAAAPDLALSFEPGPAYADAGAGWACVTTAWPTKEGPPKLFVASGKSVRALGSTATVAFPSGADSAPPTLHGLLPIDWSNSFRDGLVLAGAGGVRFIEVAADGTLRDVTDASSKDSALLSGNYFGAWAADIDLDGDLDVILGTREGQPVVLRNQSDGTFDKLQPFAGVTSVRDFAWADLDGDGAPDACFVDAGGKVSIFANDRMGKFHLRSAPKVIADGVVAIAAADVGHRSVLDLVALTKSGELFQISDRDGSDWDVRLIARIDGVVGSAGPGECRLIVDDLDNNGEFDFVATGPSGSRVLLSTGGGKFQSVIASPPNRVVAVTRSGDGRATELVALSSDGAVSASTVHSVKGYHSVNLRPRAAQVKGDGRINSFGLGGELEARAGLMLEKKLISSGEIHVGIGDASQLDVARIIWPNGSVQAEFDLPADKDVTAEQRLKGSCPWLFAFDGTRMQFVTDLIWRSPLGLRINAQDTAPAGQTRDWVKVRGDQLRPRDGYYDLRVTAELWETHFFDYLGLMTVDHPKGTEIFVDERFAFSPPNLDVFVTRTPKPVTKALDERGADVSELVRARDGRYLGTFPLGTYQGIAADHWVEIELGDEFPQDKPLALLAFGWIHPTDSSINVAIAQGTHPKPQGLVIEVPDKAGGWRVARDGIGFPAGKNKTIVLPLEGLWKAGEPRRLRLRTNLEIYWDSLACAELVDRSTAKIATIAPQSAELRHRGYSMVQSAGAGSPELPDYDHLVGVLPRWRDLIGYYTRFGDVKELLANVDDRYVIMNAGDELRLQFPQAAEPELGITRDYIVVADGWEKDGDYNTAASKTVLPLPRHDWPAYNVNGNSLHEDPAYQRHPEDWERYHTRYVTPESFRDALRAKEGSATSPR